MATSPFWITGLPRSRTAWFSVAMRGAQSTCAHELTAIAQSYDDLKRLWLASDCAFSGNADSGCGLHVHQILADIQPRTLVIDRPIGQVLASCERAFGRPIPRLADRLERLRSTLQVVHPLVKRVRFSDLGDRDALAEAAEWLVPGHGEQAAQLADMNIQVMPERIAELAYLPHTLWHLKEAA